MINSQKCRNCGSLRDHVGIFRAKMKYPLRDWCMLCINEFFKKPDMEQERILKYEREHKPFFLNEIDWNNEKNVIIAIFIFMLLLAIALAIKRDFGDTSDYKDIPIEECVPPDCAGGFF